MPAVRNSSRVNHDAWRANPHPRRGESAAPGDPGHEGLISPMLWPMCCCLTHRAQVFRSELRGHCREHTRAGVIDRHNPVTVGHRVVAHEVSILRVEERDRPNRRRGGKGS